MDTFLMICRVCAEFNGGKGLFFAITPANRGVFVQAPKWIKETRMFKGLLADGSITVALGKAEKKKLENDPNEGVGADGKAVNAEETPEETPEGTPEGTTEGTPEGTTEGTSDADPEDTPEEEKPEKKPTRTKKAAK